MKIPVVNKVLLTYLDRFTIKDRLEYIQYRKHNMLHELIDKYPSATFHNLHFKVENMDSGMRNNFINKDTLLSDNGLYYLDGEYYNDEEIVKKIDERYKVLAMYAYVELCLPEDVSDET